MLFRLAQPVSEIWLEKHRILVMTTNATWRRNFKFVARVDLGHGACNVRANTFYAGLTSTGALFLNQLRK